jgi:mannose-1-phosphate guanylyltransferase/phosphomannomutase
MAGGEGTRLRPLTGAVPKPLVKLCGKPAVLYILDLLALHGCDEAVLTLCYKGEMLESLFDGEDYRGIKLSFSYESEPLGTAGSVKKAAAGFREPFLVLSGDALCDFDFTSLYNAHVRSGASATITAKSVTDPREYGVIIAENGIVTGFSEKPSYIGCVSDRANTGVYVISPEVLTFISDGKPSDFAHDLFPDMMNAGKRIACHDEQGYWCDIGDTASYLKCCSDIMAGNLKCSVNAKKIAGGVWSDSPVPEHALIVPPCYIGKNVRIGDNAIVEGTAIGDNVTIGRSCRISGSVIGDGVFIAEDVSIAEAVVCDGAKIKPYACLCSGSVLGRGSVAGERSVLLNNVRVFDNKEVPPNAEVRADVRKGGVPKTEFGERGISGETNIDITPETAARLGAALTATDADNIIVSCDKNNASLALKNALLSGISGAGGTGGDCGFAPFPELVNLSRLVGADMLVHVSALARTRVNITAGCGLPIERADERKIEGSLARGDYSAAPYDGFGEIRSVKCADELYTAFLRKYSNFKSRYNITAVCGNEPIQQTAERVLRQISDVNGESITITLSHSGTRAEFSIGGLKIPHDRLMLMAVAGLMKSGYNVSLPVDFPSVAEFVGRSLGRKVMRFSLSSQGGDKDARDRAKQEPFLYDGLYLSLLVLASVTRDKISIAEANRSLPLFARENRVVSISCPPQKILSEIYSNSNGKAKTTGDGVTLGADGGSVTLRSSRRGNSLFMYAESLNAETARSLCDDVEKKVQTILSAMKK